MKMGLVDVDSHNFPNLALMKISAYHKRLGHDVEFWQGNLLHYDIVYKSRVFDDTYSHDDYDVWNADKVVCGGTGYGLDNRLPDEIEHIYPDYTLYPIDDTAYGYLTRGCPRDCPFCIVAQKEGKKSVKVADLSEFWRGQRYIKLLDPNLLACAEHSALLQQLVDSGAWVDFTQGLDVRLVSDKNIDLLNKCRVKRIHFAWDNPMDDLTDVFARVADGLQVKDPRRRLVYVLVNFNSEIEDDLYRIYKLIELGYNPYVMVYDKPNAPRQIRELQRWCNSFRIRAVEPDFSKYQRM